MPSRCAPEQRIAPSTDAGCLLVVQSRSGPRRRAGAAAHEGGGGESPLDRGVPQRSPWGAPACPGRGRRCVVHGPPPAGEGSHLRHLGREAAVRPDPELPGRGGDILARRSALPAVEQIRETLIEPGLPRLPARRATSARPCSRIHAPPSRSRPRHRRGGADPVQQPGATTASKRGGAAAKTGSRPRPARRASPLRPSGPMISRRRPCTPAPAGIPEPRAPRHFRSR